MQLDHGTGKCEWCQRVFKKRRRKQRFHSDECRAAWWQLHDQKARDLLAAKDAAERAVGGAPAG